MPNSAFHKLTKQTKQFVMKHISKFIALSIIVMIAIFYSFISHSQIDSSRPQISTKTSPDSNQDYNKFLKNVIVRIKKDYVEEKTDKELAEAAAEGILSSLDPHSSYLNFSDLKEMQIQTKGEFGGVGIEITMEYSLVKIISAIDDTPAAAVGIKSGDYISKIDGKSVVGMKITDVVKKLRGKPKTQVSVTILRKGEKAPFDLIITRDQIKIKAVKSDQMGDVAYIKISSFSEQSYSGMSLELKKIINKIGRDKIKGIVLDLRNNPGGLLDESIKISDFFLDKDQKIVSISGRDKSKGKIYKDNSNQTLTKNIPVIVLINEGSASASEIVAGALQDHQRAIIMGTKSFGKGSVQSIIPLTDNLGAIKMTTALYYTPSDRSIQAHGIEPDIIVNEAKIEKVKKGEIESIRSEASLDGHLKTQISEELRNNNKSQIDDINFNLYETDYQLARAIDLLRGISVYKKFRK